MAGQPGEPAHRARGQETSLGCWVCALHIQELSGMGLEGEKFHIKPLAAGIEQGQRVAGAGKQQQVQCVILGSSEARTCENEK